MRQSLGCKDKETAWTTVRSPSTWHDHALGVGITKPRVEGDGGKGYTDIMEELGGRSRSVDNETACVELSVISVRIYTDVMSASDNSDISCG